MRSHLQQQIFLLLLITIPISIQSQVAIGTKTVEDGVMFQMESTNKGLLIPRVSLTSRSDVTTIAPSAVEGLWVYNTSTAGIGNDKVSEGMYFWDSSEWIRIYNEGYSEQFFQSIGVKSENQTTSYTLPGLDQTITPPYTGTYQIIVVCHYASGLQASGPEPGVGTSSVWLEIDTVKMAETWLTSSSKQIGTGSAVFHALGQNGLIIINVDLEAGTSYDIRVRAKEWNEDNTFNTFLDGLYGTSGAYGFWGIDSSYYNGNSFAGADPNCQINYMTITLLRQF
jgi:hypothetical protein